jgi:hypothetical protein
MIIKSVNLRPRGVLKVQISMQNQWSENPSNHFFSSKGCEHTPTLFIYAVYMDTWSN